jgi:hypothetical protein
MNEVSDQHEVEIRVGSVSRVQAPGCMHNRVRIKKSPQATTSDLGHSPIRQVCHA